MAIEETLLGDELQTERRTYLRPPVHWCRASFVISEDLCPIFARECPSGTDDYLVSTSFEADFLPGDQYAVLLTESNWTVGRKTSNGYEAFSKYSLKLRAVGEDGSIKQSSPPIPLSITIIPQREGVYPDGNNFEPPYGKGTQIKIQTTGVTDSDQFIERARTLLNAAINYNLPEPAVKPASKRVLKIETTHRFDRDELLSVVETVRDTEALITAIDEPLEAYRNTDGNGYIEAELSSSRFAQLGLPTNELEANIKVYSCAVPETDSVIRHPRIEAWINPESPRPHFDDYDQLLGRLRAIVCAHLRWADVGQDSIVTNGDLLYDSSRPVFEWDHPLGRHEQLREYYNSVVTEVRREALKPHTMSVYDILRTVLEYPGCTYEELQQEVGLSYSSVVRHVSRLVDKGIFQRMRSAITFVKFDSTDLRRKVQTALKKIFPEDSEEDREKRRRQRRRRRRQQDRTSNEGADETTEAVSVAESSHSTEEVAQQLARDELSAHEVYIRDPPPDDPP